MLFLGTFDYAMDERGRVPLPPRYREAFRDGIVLSQGSPDRCIFLHTMEAFQRHARDVTARPALHRSGRVLRRGLFHGAYEASLDSQNRILIPASLRDYAKLNGKVLLFGTGEWLELWCPEEYEAELGRVAEELPAAQESAGAFDR